ncbi:LysR family transcriptional regulator [Pseudooceanicola nanhaiensis]|uniref:LysR family transcriptional regulator n=1 Tax=Pseudooceanicola nanhaiensis TaxID=375761 RepID=UPI001CD6F194|nr:LysR family transcriptional regulator [Pseudooceanicola nanhaiensis]MCA0920838.1 LysR family transcriptional regulator [Pseudooceanicola nanhaiensis]
MNARQLEIFRTIMRDGSVTAAANTLAVSQPSVSKVLHHLEDQLGYKLFERIAGRLVPTMEAHLLYDDADRVFREIEALKTLARTIGERKMGLLRIGASPPFTHSILAQALHLFRRDYPMAKLHLHALPKADISEQLLVGDIDLALTLSTIQAPTVRSEVLAGVPLVVLMREDDPLAGLEAVTPTDLAGQTLISYGGHADVGPALDAAFAAEGQSREVAIQISSSIGAVPLVSGGLGVALVDGLVQWSSFPGLVVRPFAPAVMMHVSISSNSARPVSRYYAPFRRMIADLLQNR